MIGKEVRKLAKCVVFCAGEFSGLIEPITDGDLVIAADGGYGHLEALGIRPQIILGDFDSLGYVPENATVFPVEKDDTDAMLAAKKGLNAGFREFVFYGALEGPRLDHTIANFQMLQFLADHGAFGSLIGKTQIVTLIDCQTITFPSTATGILSLLCMGKDATGVTLQGLQYPLTDGILTAGFPLGVSNHFIGEPVSVTVKTGSLLMIYDRVNGLGKRA
jgi:thiamine pyrophosphokinase